MSVDGTPRLDAAVTVPPTALLAFTAGTGGATDVHTVRGVSVSVPSAAAAAPTGAGWTRYGSATLTGTDLVLTPATATQAGTSFLDAPVPTAGLRASFTAQIGGGTGADGLTFALIDPAKAGTARLGRSGGALAYAPLPGVAVALDTYQNGSDPAANFVGVATGATGPNADNLTWAATSTAVAPLRTGTHTVDIWITTARHVLVAVDGVRRIDVALPAGTLPDTAAIGFTAATGGQTDAHTVRSVQITRQ